MPVCDVNRRIEPENVDLGNCRYLVHVIMQGFPELHHPRLRKASAFESFRARGCGVGSPNERHGILQTRWDLIEIHVALASVDLGLLVEPDALLKTGVCAHKPEPEPSSCEISAVRSGYPLFPGPFPVK